VDALALAAALARPWADVVLSGAAAVEQLRSNLAALDVVWDAKAEARLAGLAEAPEAFWAERGRLAWS
jgi:aryl-alcohol dehydrogenase-like predicted oxidoreductase